MIKTILGCMLIPLLLISGCITAEDPMGGGRQGAWTLVRNQHNAAYYRGLYFADQNSGWAVGDSGIVLHTGDGGITWDRQASGTTEPLKCVFFAGTQKGWIGGGNNSIGMTTNGGVTWTWQHPAGKPKRMFMSLSFVNESLGWIVENNSGILHTTDGGLTWTPQVSGTTWAITSVQFLDALEGWAVSTNAEVLHTTDGGSSWTSRTLGTLDYGGAVPIFNDIFFSTRSKGWIATNVLASSIAHPAAPVVATSDGGTSWTCQSTPEQQAINALHFAGEYDGWAACYGGICATTNGGATWTYELPGADDRAFVDIFFTDRSHGWALTSHGSVYRYER